MKYAVTYKALYKAVVEADSPEEAADIAEGMDGSEFDAVNNFNNPGWELESVKLIA